MMPYSLSDTRCQRGQTHGLKGSRGGAYAEPFAHAHRFRHMLATEILARSGTEPDCADILGVSRSVVREASR